MKSFNGCWTCRLRRKKCDEKRPVCDGCAALYITCYYDQAKPEWMDGGPKQEEMAERLKREVREKARRRRTESTISVSGDSISITEDTTSGTIVLPQRPLGHLASPTCDLLQATPHIHDDGMQPSSHEAPTIWRRRGPECPLTMKDARQSMDFGRSDTILLMFYLEHLLPFLFPFYRPSLLQGGRAWILEMMMSSPVVRQATLCQSSYFFSLARGTTTRDVAWETVLKQTRDAFEVLRHALRVIDSSDITEHLHGAVRIMASIMHVQRFEIAVSSFDNCQAHLNAALALFRQLLDRSDTSQPPGSTSNFHTIMRHLGPLAWTMPTHCLEVSSAEQSAFRFSSTLLILDDIIASTVLQEQPRLYDYHRSLLCNGDGTESPIDLETVIGCQNWVLVQIGEIAVLDAWKQQYKRARNLDIMELVRRATVIKESLEGHLTRLDADRFIFPTERNSLLDVFTADDGHQSKTLASQSVLVTRVWAHAALIYLFVVVSGWQPANVDVRYHVNRIIELLTHQISPPALLRTMVWPFCVAGCLAEPAQEAHLRRMVEELQPPSVFGTVRKALEIMENVWSNRDTGDAVSRDLAMCFRSQGNLVLLV